MKKVRFVISRIILYLMWCYLATCIGMETYHIVKLTQEPKGEWISSPHFDGMWIWVFMAFGTHLINGLYSIIEPTTTVKVLRGR